MLEVDERIGGPQPVAQLVARHEFARPFYQGRQQVKRLLLEVQPNAGAAQLAGPDIELERVEPDDMSSRNGGLDHRVALPERVFARCEILARKSVEIGSLDDEGVLHSGPENGGDPRDFWTRFESVRSIQQDPLACCGSVSRACDRRTDFAPTPAFLGTRRRCRRKYRESPICARL
jgi:hypothetical protein